MVFHMAANFKEIEVFQGIINSAKWNLPNRRGKN